MSRANYNASNNSRPDSDQKKAEGGFPSTRNSMHPQHHPWEEAHEQNYRRRFGGDADANAAEKKNRANTLASEVRHRLLASIRTLEQTLLLVGPSSSSACTRKLGILLSGGVDSCAILAACQASQANLVAAVTVSIQAEPDGANNCNRDDPGPALRRTPPQDELYACEAVRLYNTNINTKINNATTNTKINNATTSPPPKLLEHSIVRLSPAQLIEHYTKPTIAALHVWGYMDTRNSLIISAGLHECSKLGITDILVGDNADELFGGSYDCYFDAKYGTDPEGWKRKRDGMARLPFVTQKLADVYGTTSLEGTNTNTNTNTLGLTVHQPFTDPTLFVDWALQTTTRTDCIDVAKTCRLQSEYAGPYTNTSNTKCGKLPLREAFCTVASWRQMDWIFRGSGAETGDALIQYYGNSLGISEAEFVAEQQRYKTEEGIGLQSKEQLYNLRIYATLHDGFYHPTKQRYPIGDPRGCISCCFEIGDEQFCHLCDAYPAQHPSSINSKTTKPSIA